MCGIVGLVCSEPLPEAEACVQRMTALLAHRGPDGSGVLRRGNAVFGHARLAILDPAGGKQPLGSDDGRILLTYNGEIYNFAELREQLRGRHIFRTNCDTEVILRAYEEWGIDCLQRFRGMFALAVFDSRRQRLYVVRDRVGIKPVYYVPAKGPDGQALFAFCSELAPLVATGLTERNIDPAAVAAFFRWQYVPTPLSIYRDIRKLRPGHFIEQNTATGEWRERCYWKFEAEPHDWNEEEALQHLNELLAEITRLYVRSDVPFGAFLSGGVDSSLVTALMQQHLKEPVRTFSIGYREQQHSELSFAAAAAHTLQTRHQAETIEPPADETFFARVARHFGEPFADSSALPTWHVSRLAARQVKMVLSGDGGDELFGGYRSYETLFARQFSHRFHTGRMLPRLLNRLPLPERLQRRWASYRGDWFEQHLSFRELCYQRELNALLTGETIGPDPFRPEVKAGDFLQACQQQDFATYLVDDVLTKVDRMSMACSLEVRVPLLDHKLVEFAFTLPLSLRMRWQRPENSGGPEKVVSKYLLRRSAGRFFSPSFLQRPKQGFGIPVVEWCRGQWKPLLSEVVNDRRNPVFDWVHHDEVQKLLQRFEGGEDSPVNTLWCLLMFHFWLQEVHGAGTENIVWEKGVAA